MKAPLVAGLSRTAEPDVKGEPVKGFGIKFSWCSELEPAFDKLIELIRDDLDRAVVADKLIFYLSCPVSGYGGGFPGTNVEIARFTENRLLNRFGERAWVLNPTRYQMESKEGTGLIGRFLAKPELDRLGHPGGGDYMRMWTRVLVENRRKTATTPPLGTCFDAFYFMGPSDMAAFFTQAGGTNLTGAIETYFARQYATDADFHTYYTQYPESSPHWEQQRRDFFRYYAVRAGAGFSRGSHDEWNILRKLNDNRRKAYGKDGIGQQIAGFYDGTQISPGAAERAVSRGYAV